MASHGPASIGQAFEFSAALLRALPRVMERMDPDRIQHFIGKGDELAELLGAALAQNVGKTVNLAAEAKVIKGYTVTSHTPGDAAFVWDPAKVTLFLSPEQEGDEVIKGTELQPKVIKQAPFNANLLDYLLLEHPELIPADWKGKEVFFWGTVYRDAGGDACVRCLSRDGGGWCWRARWLGRGWDAHHPAAVLAKV